MMQFSKFVSAVAMGSFLIPMAALAEVQKRLVVTYSEPQVGAMSAMSVKPEREIFVVPDGQDPNVVAKMIKQIPGVSQVEEDIYIPPRKDTQKPLNLAVTRMSLLANGARTNDPERVGQYYWDKEDDTFPGVSDFQAAYDSGSAAKKVNVAVLDGGFENNEDMTWSGGYDLSTIDSPTGPDYLTYDETTCPSYHGQAVGAIIGATTGNGVGMAGMVDANMYAIRVLGCNGNGFLSETADGIRHAAGDPSITGASIEQPIDVINLSLGAPTPTCPSYLQSAIDYAVERGIDVVVAAGNESSDAANYAPANCKNVITVGSVTRQGDKSGFSNFGSLVDVSAMGSAVLTQGSFNPYSLWFGTSFAAPIVSGVVAHLKASGVNLPPRDMEALIKSSAIPLGGLEEPMGTGVVNARKALAQYESIISELPSLSAIGFSGERCDSSFYDNRFSETIETCGLNEFDPAGATKADAEYYAVFAIPKGGSKSLDSAQLVKASIENKFVVEGIDTQSYDYGYAVCSDSNGSACSSSNAIPIDFRNAASSTECSLAAR
jgi:subtilisin family serine protease